MNLFEKILTVLGGISFIVFLSFLVSWPVYMLWNYCLVGAVNGVNEVSWLQAWGLNLLFGFLFTTNVKVNAK